MAASSRNGASSIGFASRIRSGVQYAEIACCGVTSAPYFLRPAASAAPDTWGVDDALPASWAARALGLAEAAEGTRADVQASTATVARPMRLADGDASI